MKKGVILLELIFTILIVSTVAIISVTLLQSLYQKLSNEHQTQIAKLESSSTYILLNKIFDNAIDLRVNGDKIEFKQNDTSLFDLGYYSRFVDLNSSNSSSIFSPNTKAENLIDYLITFDGIKFYEIRNDSFAEEINFEESGTKEIKEQYKIASNSLLEYKENTLYLNGSILLNNVSLAVFKYEENILSLSLIVKDIPYFWKLKIKNM